MQAQTQVKGLKELGLEPSEIFHNLSYDEIYEHEKKTEKLQFPAMEL